jgi:endonuclease/exonuclease/phosphatase family metal-dependent hydrolase
MHAGAGDLPRLLADFADGRLTGARPSDYVVLLQEAIAGGRYDPAVTARDRQLSIAYEPVGRRERGVTGNAILSTLALAETRAIELPRERQRRAALAATITVAGERLFVANAHLENRVSLWRGLLFSDGARGRQAQALIAALPAGHGIAGGDLNTWLGPQEPAWKAFAARFGDTPGGRREPTVRDRLVLDHLFFDVPDGWRVERRVVQDSYGSDHRPVIGIVTVPSSSRPMP